MLAQICVIGECYQSYCLLASINPTMLKLWRGNAKNTGENL